MDPIYLRLNQAAQVVNLSKRKLYEAVATEDLPSKKVGKARLIAVEDLRKWVESH